MAARGREQRVEALGSDAVGKTRRQFREQLTGRPTAVAREKLAWPPGPEDVDGASVHEEALTGDRLRLVGAEREHDRSGIRRIPRVERIFGGGRAGERPL